VPSPEPKPKPNGNDTGSVDAGAVADCPPGTYVADEKDGVSRTCSGCPSGTFSVLANASACEPWTVCGAPSSYASAPPTATSDRTCAPCGEGTQTSVDNEASCMPSGASCAPGTEPGTGLTDAGVVECIPCAAGTYCPGGSVSRTPCASGTWDHDKQSATACVAKTVCVAGERVADEGSAEQDRMCVACASGTFSSGDNVAECVAWSDCPKGSFVLTPGSASADRACAPCAADTFSAQENQSVCLSANARGHEATGRTNRHRPGRVRDVRTRHPLPGRHSAESSVLRRHL